MTFILQFNGLITEGVLHMKYPVAESALIKWSTERLQKIELSDTEIHYRYRLDGSTCSNGGMEFKAYLHARISTAPHSIIQKAWIEIPKEDQVTAAHMCRCPNRNPKEAQSFFEDFKEDASFSGESLTETILMDIPLNHAGCLCYKPMVDQKWKMALSTIHYVRQLLD
jgi:hypothetical protein